MKLPSEFIQKFSEWMDKEVDKRIKDYPIKIFIGNKIVDWDKREYDGGDINIFIKEPLYFPETDEMVGLMPFPKDEK